MDGRKTRAKTRQYGREPSAYVGQVLTEPPQPLTAENRSAKVWPNKIISNDCILQTGTVLRQQRPPLHRSVARQEREEGRAGIRL